MAGKGKATVFMKNTTELYLNTIFIICWCIFLDFYLG